jgi:hypothetical protein
MGCNGLVLRREKPEPPMSQLGQNPKLPRRNSNGRFTPRQALELDQARDVSGLVLRQGMPLLARRRNADMLALPTQ